jgi:hypothetical protein
MMDNVQNRDSSINVNVVTNLWVLLTTQQQTVARQIQPYVAQSHKQRGGRSAIFKMYLLTSLQE